MMRYKGRNPVLEAFAILHVDVGRSCRCYERRCRGDTEEEVVTFMLITVMSHIFAISS